VQDEDNLSHCTTAKDGVRLAQCRACSAGTFSPAVGAVSFVKKK